MKFTYRRLRTCSITVRNPKKERFDAIVVVTAQLRLLHALAMSRYHVSADFCKFASSCKFLHVLAISCTFLNAAASFCTACTLIQSFCTPSNLPNFPRRFCTFLQVSALSYNSLHAPARSYWPLHAPETSYTLLQGLARLCTLLNAPKRLFLYADGCSTIRELSQLTIGFVKTFS